MPQHSNKNIGTFGSSFDHKCNLKKVLLLIFYDDVTTGASEPADESIKLIKYQVYHFSQNNIRQ